MSDATRRVRVTAFVAVTALAGCIDYLPLPSNDDLPAGAEPAHLWLGITSPASGDSLHVLGALHPGHDTDGRLRVVVDGTLRVGDFAIEPDEDPGDSVLRYARAVPRKAMGAGEPVRVEFPRIAATRDAPGPLALLFPAMEGPAEVTITAFRDPVLRLRPGGSDPGAGRRWWALTLDAGDDRSMLQRDGAEPDSIRIPRELLPGTAGQHVRATLSALTSIDRRSEHLDYQTHVSVSSHLVWTLVPTAP